MKKYIPLVLVLVCVFLFSGCSDKATTFNVEEISKLNIKSPFGEVTITDNAFIHSITENINSLDFERNSATDEEENYVYLLTWLDTDGSQIASVAITEENGSQISYNGYYYNVSADRCIDVEAINNKIIKLYSSSLITDYEVISSETDNSEPKQQENINYNTIVIPPATNGRILFYCTPLLDNQFPGEADIAGHYQMDSAELSNLLDTLKEQKWVWDALIDRIFLNTDGQIYYNEKWLYFSYEYRTFFYDGYLCEVSDNVMENIKNYADNMFKYEDIDGR